MGEGLSSILLLPAGGHSPLPPLQHSVRHHFVLILACPELLRPLKDSGDQLRRLLCLVVTSLDGGDVGDEIAQARRSTSLLNNSPNCPSSRAFWTERRSPIIPPTSAFMSSIQSRGGLRIGGGHGSLAVATVAPRHWSWGRAAATSASAILVWGRRLWNRPSRSLTAGCGG